MAQLEGFSPGSVFNDDYLYFYADRLSPSRTNAELERLCEVAGFAAGETVLDLACGQGRITNGLATRGLRVVGLDISRQFVALGRARAEPLVTGAGDHRASYVVGDMYRLAFKERFDVAVSWYTSFGYAADEVNQRILEEVFTALRRGGRIIIDLNERDRLVAPFIPTVVIERGRDLLIEQFEFDSRSARLEVRRTVIRDEAVHKSEYFVRLFSFTEIAEMLTEAGFVDVDVVDSSAGRHDDPNARMIVTAHRP